jgi:hypothetical protein
MKYNQPLDKPSDANASYFDGNPKAGIQGSIVPAASIELDQREVVEVITRANARGYVDFSGTPCAAPANSDLMQLRKAIEGFITGWSFIIDTTITFKVHGAGYDFVDLNAAMAYLRKYYITSRGHVILQLAGAATGSAAAVQYIYAASAVFRHPNADRISVFGANMLAPVPVTDTGYASNGSAVATRAADTNSNLAMLRTKFATELHFTGGTGIFMGPNCPTLMHLDGVLVTSDGGLAGGGGGVVVVNSFGELNPDTHSGLAIVGFANWGMVLELGCAAAIGGGGNSENTLCPLICIGNGTNTAGFALGDGSYFSMSGNLISLSNNGHGFMLHPRTGCQMDGGVHSQSNAMNGVNIYMSPTCFINGPMSGGTAYEYSHIWKNGQYGIQADHGFGNVYADCGAGGANANTSGSIRADYGSNVHCYGGDQHISATCSPAFGTVGNGNSWIG